MYYKINENAARIAHNMNSFFEFKEGKATAEYRAAVDEATEIAEAHKRHVFPIHHEKIDGLLDAFARRLAAWYNNGFAIDARCPSVMVSGPANFPARKKEKQNAARDRHIREYDNIYNYLNKIRATGTGGISSDDPDALDKLKAKLVNLEANQAMMKRANAYFCKHKTLTGFAELSDEEICQHNANMAHWRWMIAPFNLFGGASEIHRIKSRIAELERRAVKPLQGWKFNGGEVVANAEANRLQILFDTKPDEALRTELKRSGFRWAPSQHAWQRQLTRNAILASKNIEAVKP